MTTQVGFGRGGSPATPLVVGGFSAIGAGAEPTHGPGEFLRLVFEWSGTPPSPTDFELVRVTAVDARSDQLADFDVQVSVQ
jgi:hypothetical protein